MADQDVDLSKLTDEQLQVYRDLLHQKEFDKQAKETPGPPALPPLPSITPAGMFQKKMESNPDYAVFNPPTTDEAELQRRYAANQRGVSGSMAAMLPGPWWLRAFNGVTTKTPADLGTNAALNAVFPLANKLKAPTQVGNAALGTLKGLGLFEGGSRLHAALNGDQQPPANPLQRNPMDLAFGALSGGLGGAQGWSEVPAGDNPLDIARRRFSDYQKQQAALDTQLAETQAERLSANNAAADAQKRLNSHEQMMDSRAENAATTERKAFQSRQADLRAEAKSLGFDVANAKIDWQKAAKAAATHENAMTGRQNFDRALTAENLTDQILEHQKRLDALRNPDTAEAVRGTSPEETAARAEIQRLNDLLDSGKLNAGGEAQVNSAIERHQNTLDDAGDANTRTAVDATKARLRDLKEMRRRVNQGRVEDVPTEDDLAQARKLIDLRGTQTEAERNLADLNQKYQAKVLEQLTHARNAPGSTMADVNDLVTQQNLKSAAEQSIAAKRAAADKFQQIKIAKARLAEQAPDKPSQGQETIDNVLKYVSKGAPLALGAAGGHITGSIIPMGEVLGGVTGLALQGLSKTQAGQRLLNFLATHVSPNASKAIPAAVNQASRSQQ